ncbi:MAG: trypsin-like serine protease, partial [Pirellulaceae bacterium]|nr:trypsin-like serine protease [Pirellulaceae bacterium]
MLSINGGGIDCDWLGESANPFLPPSARAAQEPAREAGEWDFGVDEHVEDSLLDDIDSYIPMPTPTYSETSSPSGLGQAISYDVRTGQETLHPTAMGPFSASGQALGGYEEVAALLAEMDSDASGDGDIELSFSSLSLVDDPDIFPWRVNVKLFMNFSGSNYVASGVLIDPMHVLTAGHCVYDSDEGGWATSITVVPAYENGAKPYGEAKSVGLHSWTGWTQSRDYDHDIAVIDLDRPIGALTSWYGYGYNSSSFFYTGNTFHNAGYPAASPYNGRYMYYQYGDFDYFIPFTNRVGIWREAFGGQSGSGAYHSSDGSRTVYAVLSNGNDSATNFIRLTDSKFYDIRDDFIADDTPSTFDLIPLNVKASPGTINSGAAPSSMSYVVHNYSSAAWSGTVNVDVYLSTNNTITTADTLLQSHSFTRSFSAKGTNTITVGTPPTIPAATASGNYWIGVIITTTDHSTGNNTTNGWDAAAITVSHVNQAPVISPLPDRSLNEDASLVNTIDLWAYVSDSETSDSGLTYSIVTNTNPDCGVTINSQRYVNVNPVANWNGYSDVTIRVTDPGGLYAQDTFRVTVNPVNDAPTIAALPDVSLNEDASLASAIDLWAYVSDPET